MFLLIQFAVYFSIVCIVISLSLGILFGLMKALLSYFSDEFKKERSNAYEGMNLCVTLAALYYIHRYV